MCWLTAARTAANTGPQPAPQALHGLSFRQTHTERERREKKERVIGEIEGAPGRGSDVFPGHRISAPLSSI